MDSTRPTEQDRLLTPAELELMTVLWDSGEGTVRNVIDGLPADRSPAYTTVSTILRILEKKGFVTTRREGRSHVYVPGLPRAHYERRNLRSVLGSLFQGDAPSLVRRLVDAEDLSDAQLEEIRRIVDERLGS